MKKIALFLVFIIGFISTTDAQFWKKKPKKEVPGQMAVLTRHPDEVKLLGTDLNEYYLFFDLKNKCLFFTDKPLVYLSISEFLPEKQIIGRKVEIDGPSINPLTIFTKDQLATKSKLVGFGINRFNTFRLMNYILIEPTGDPLPEKKDNPVIVPERKKAVDTLTKPRRSWG